MSRFIIYAAGLAILLIVTFSLYARPTGMSENITSHETAKQDVQDLTLVPQHTAPASYLNDEQNAKVMKWEKELLGMRIGDFRNATTFARADLPSKCRVRRPGYAYTTDVDLDRLDVRTNEAGVVIKVDLG